MTSQFSLASVTYNKLPGTIIASVMKMWIRNGMGTPEKFLTDNCGEFSNTEYRDMCENLNIEFTNTAAYCPWQNGLCERNHAVVDICVSKTLEENKDMKLEIALI